jgi:hypothetical protein
MPEPIYVVGFPKSGNTWLVRLLADALVAPVQNGAMDGNREPATEVNQSLPTDVTSEYETFKIHYQPHVFFEKVDSAPRRVAYIYRDARDVAISSFFYFAYTDRIYAKRHSLPSLAVHAARQGPHFLMLHRRARKKLQRYIQEWCVSGVLGFGTWSQHVTSWERAATVRPHLLIAFVSYENLLQDTEGSLARLVRDLDLPEPPGSRLKAAVSRQSFSAQKKRFAAQRDAPDDPFGSQFQAWFLRKGVSGDWRQFLSARNARVLHQHHGKTLMALGYESDHTWYTRVRREAGTRTQKRPNRDHC